MKLLKLLAPVGILVLTGSGSACSSSSGGSGGGGYGGTSGASGSGTGGFSGSAGSAGSSGGVGGASGAGAAGGVGGASGAGASGGFGASGGVGGVGGGTGGAGASGGAPGNCDPGPGLGAACTQIGTGTPACDTCMHTNCCSQMEGCFGDEECAGLQNCLNTNCAGITDQAQFDMCAQQSCGTCATSQATIDLYNAIPTCLTTSCSTDCA
jgi:hypothetical protein